MNHRITMTLSGLGLSVLLLVPACAASHADKQAAPDPAPAHKAAAHTWHQAGMASWYGGPRWQGNTTFSGEPFDQHDLTAAHATLPMGTDVRVTVADTGRSVAVTINDRIGNDRRIIDLSRAAARKLGIVEQGIARVRLRKVRK